MHLIIPDYKYYDSYRFAYFLDLKNINYYNYHHLENQNQFYNWHKTINNLSNHYKIFWLVDQEIFIGEILLFLENDKWEIGYIISPIQRKKGYGKKILQLGLLKAKELKINLININASIKNEASNKIIKYNNGQFLLESENCKGELTNYYQISL